MQLEQHYKQLKLNVEIYTLIIVTGASTQYNSFIFIYFEDAYKNINIPLTPNGLLVLGWR